jgi:3-dehydroquinate dehydratase/shikimate dehydrogenase
MPKICLSLTGRTLAANIAVLERYRPYIDMAELRVDCLEDEERYLIRRFPKMANEKGNMPILLTIRRKCDGGFWEGPESERIVLFAKALLYAEADQRHNFTYMDMEGDLYISSLEEAARAYGTRIIRSTHDLSGTPVEIAKKLLGLRRYGDEIVKGAFTIKSIGDVRRLHQASVELSGVEKILVGMGDLGRPTRILAERFGSWLTFTSPADNNGEPAGFQQAAPGHFDPETLVKNYRFRGITASTKLYAMAGKRVETVKTPAFFNSVFEHENIDAAYIPFPADDFDTFMALAGDLGLRGITVSNPYKYAALKYLDKQSPAVSTVSACNIMTRAPDSLAWEGGNTDAPGFSQSLLAFLGAHSLKRLHITIIGGGAAARAIAREVYRLDGKGLIINRTNLKAAAIATPYNFRWGTFDEWGLQQMHRHSDIIVQATALGAAPDVDADPFPEYEFRGGEVVMDINYNPPQTAFLKRAARAGCRVLGGRDMLLRQGRLQYKFFTGNDYPEDFVANHNAN